MCFFLYRKQTVLVIGLCGMLPTSVRLFYSLMYMMPFSDLLI